MCIQENEYQIQFDRIIAHILCMSTGKNTCKILKYKQAKQPNKWTKGTLGREFDQQIDNEM